MEEKNMHVELTDAQAKVILKELGITDPKQIMIRFEVAPDPGQVEIASADHGRQLTLKWCGRGRWC